MLHLYNPFVLNKIVIMDIALIYMFGKIVNMH